MIIWYSRICFYLFLAASLLMACQDTPKETSVNPETLAQSEQELSKADLKKLSEAKGVRVTMATASKIAELMEEESNPTVYSILNLNCAPCLQMAQELEQIQVNSGEAFKLMHLLVDGEKDESKINTWLRSNSLASTVYSVPPSPQLFDIVSEEWKGQYPAVVISNKNDGIRLFYGRIMNPDELTAILQSVTFQ